LDHFSFSKSDLPLLKGPQPDLKFLIKIIIYNLKCGIYVCGRTKADIAYSLCQEWSSAQVCVFLDSLLANFTLSSPPSLGLLISLDNCYKFTANNNAEIKFRWIVLSLRGEVLLVMYR